MCIPEEIYFRQLIGNFLTFRISAIVVWSLELFLITALYHQVSTAVNC